MTKTMNMMGIGLAAGPGDRAYPMSRKSRDHIRSKAVVPFLGRSTIRWVLEDLYAQGVTDYLMVVKGEENYDQIKRAVGFGDRMGLRVRYSRPEDDDTNHGSGDALLTNLDRFDINDPTIVFPVDSIYDLDLKAAYESHMERKAVVTIAGFDCIASLALKKYGFMARNGKNIVTGFGEKPETLSAIGKLYPDVDPADISKLTLVASAGAYIIDSKKLREISGADAIKQMRGNELDIGKNLLPWLVGNGHKVSVFRIPRYGDLGTPFDYLATMVRCLSGEFESIERIGLYNVYDAKRRLFIDETSLEMKDGKTGKTLRKKMEDGDVVLGRNVRIGSYVEIYPGVKLDNCNVSDDSVLFKNAAVNHSQLQERCFIGEGAAIASSIIGTDTRIRSSMENPTEVSYSFVGDASDVGAGSKILDNSIVPPKGKVAAGTKLSRISI